VATLAAKLQLHDGQRLHVIGVPAELADALAELGGASEGIIVFARTSDDVRRHADTLAAAAADATGLAWAAYPKRSSGIDTDLTRDRGWETLHALGLRPVRQIALDDTWSALRFRRSEHVSGTSRSTSRS
jgi:hypothetical protein